MLTNQFKGMTQKFLSMVDASLPQQLKQSDRDLDSKYDTAFFQEAPLKMMGQYLSPYVPELDFTQLASSSVL